MNADSMNAAARPASRILPIVGALVLGAALGATGLWLTDRPAASEANQSGDHDNELPPGAVEVPETAQKNAGIELATATTARLSGALEVTGVIAADESRVAHLRPLAKGVVERIDVNLGSRVAAGQSLLSYDNVELGQLVGDYLAELSSLRQAQTDREVKRTGQARAESLIRIEAIAQQELDVRRAEFRNAEAAVASVEARVSRVEEQLHRFGLSDQDLARLRPDDDRAPHRAASHSTLRAPFAGVITRFDVAVGEVVESDKELFTVADLSTVWVLADVYEKDIARVRPDGVVTVRVDAYPDRTFTGRVTYVSDIIDEGTRTAKVRCVVDNRDGALKLQMFAKVTLDTTEQRDAVTVPADAVQQIDAQTIVFVWLAPTRFERRDVQVGRRADDRVEILAGLTGGDRVVSTGSFYLKTALLRERIGDEH